MSLREVLWDSSEEPSNNEVEVRKYFYGSSVQIPLSDNNNCIASSTALEEIIATTPQERHKFMVGSYGQDTRLAPDWIENKQRDDYLVRGLESFKIFDD